jgi:hypothetical protein
MKKLAMFCAALLCISGIVSTANAIILNIDVGDQPYYTYGPGYWRGGVYWVWVPGHWCGWRHGHRVWCHGHYGRR